MPAIMPYKKLVSIEGLKINSYGIKWNINFTFFANSRMKKSLLQLHLAVLFWGFTGVLGRSIHLSAPVLVWYRMLIAAFILGIIISYRKQWQKFTRNDFLKVLGVGVLFSIHWVAFFGSIQNANASVAMICLATSGIFTAILYPLTNKQKINIQEIIFGLIAVAGVYCMYAFQPETASIKHPMRDFGKGILLGLLASLISAIFTILNKPLTQKYLPRTLVFYEMAAGLILLSVLAPFYILKFPEVKLFPWKWDYLWLFLLGYCCTVWGQSLAMSSLKKLSPFTVTLTVNLEPIYGIILAFIFYKENEQLGIGFYIGVGLILISILMQTMLIFYQRKKITTNEHY